MDICFTNSRLDTLCNSDKKLRGRYGPRMAGLIKQRLLDLSAAENLEVMRHLPGRCHELTQNLKGCLAVDLVHPDRLAFQPNHNPIPRKGDNGLDWKRVTAIEVVGIGDYH
jgi:plasmid maintenance system killer protein